MNTVFFRRLLGCLMIIGVFALVFITISEKYGLFIALKAFCISFFLTFILAAAAWLIVDPRSSEK